MSFLGAGGGHSHHRSASPARSVISTRPGGTNVFVREKSPSRPHAHRTRSEPQGFFSRTRSRSRSRSRSPGGIAGFLGVGGNSSKHHHSKSPSGLGGFFGSENRHHSSRSRARSPGGLSGFFGGGTDHRRTRSPQSDIRSFFGGGSKHYSSTSRYGRRPRDGFLQKLMIAIKRTFRDLVRYAKNNPVKMVTLVLMPLLTSGILVKLLGSFGLKLPNSIASMVGGGGQHQGGPQGGGYYGSQGYGGPGGHGGQGQGGGSGIGLKEVLGVAKMFM